MNILFFDIDGILNSSNYFKSLGKGKVNGFNMIDESKIPYLKQIIDKTNAKIVLSSTWRILEDSNDPLCKAMYKYLIDTLAKYGLTIMDKTPIIEMNRPLEIKTWLDNQKDKSQINYVSLDDDFDYEDYNKYGISHCLVKTSFYGENGGLQQEHVDKAINILLS